MNMLDKEDYIWIENNLSTIETIVKNSSCSSMMIEFRNKVTELAKKYGQLNCGHCNTELYLAITRLYGLYVESKSKNKDNNECWNKCYEPTRKTSRKSKKTE